MKNYSVFDILGPVMIGPSSSHTAGAERIGRAAYMLSGGDLKNVTFYLHGSFAKTYRGHGTDRALVAGILGMEPYDERIKNSFEIAKEKEIEVSFIEADLGDVHPNTVRIEIEKSNGKKLEITGASIGGGNILITSINGANAELTGEYPGIIVKHRDKKGMISKITFALALGEINIVTLRLTRDNKGEIATSIIETDSKIPQDILEELSKIDAVISVISVDTV